MYVLILILHLLLVSSAYGSLAGGRPNTFSQGQNAFAGVINPANAVWIDSRFDVGAFWLHQKSNIDNRDNNPLFQPNKTDLTYRAKDIFTADAAIHKKGKLRICSKTYDNSIGLAYYTTPTIIRLRTKKNIPGAGSTPIRLDDKIEAISVIYSQQLNASHSIGLSADYFYFSHRRNGFQNSDNHLRSVAPGHVTNNGFDHSHGFGLTLGWRWKITPSLDFGAAWARKSYCGQYRKYRGYEPHHADNYFPQTVGAGFRYLFSPRLAGHLEVLWSDLGNLPGSNDNVLSNGQLNLNKRGSNKSPGPGLQDATFITLGMGYQVHSILAVGIGYTHRIRLHRSSNFLSHTYMWQTIYDILSLGANIQYEKHDIFLIFTYGFINRISGHLPLEIGGGHFVSKRNTVSFSLSWGYAF